MSIILQKGLPYNAEFSSTDYPVLSDDWSGEVSVYLEYPGAAVKSFPMVRSGNKMILAITIGDIILLDSGPYAFVSTITNSILGLSISSLEYATVKDIQTFDLPMCKLFITMGKLDNTAAGKQTKTLTNTVDGVTLVLGWQGLTITVSNAIADNISGDVIDTESISTTTDISGYAEIYVVKGLSYTVTCSGFGKSLAVDTTGLDELNLSGLF